MESNDMNSSISTRTIIASVPLQFTVGTIFDKIPLHYKIPGFDCEIVTCYFREKKKGELSHKKSKTLRSSFRNVVNLILRTGDRYINLKLSTHGNLQITGAKDKNKVYHAVSYLLFTVHQTCPEIVVEWKDKIEIVFRTVMTNMVFSVDYLIDKKKLNNVIQTSTNFYNLVETSFGYTGMNIKIPVENELQSTQASKCIEIDFLTQQHQLLDKIVSLHFKKNQKFNTFLVFHSGKVLMSGIDEQTMMNDFHLFQNFLQIQKKNIEEKIIV